MTSAAPTCSHLPQPDPPTCARSPGLLPTKGHPIHGPAQPWPFTLREPVDSPGQAGIGPGVVRVAWPRRALGTTGGRPGSLDVCTS